MTIDHTSESFLKTIQVQTVVADPGCSAWVSANAGSGKTHVLTNRVIRLLMGDGDKVPGARPASILCITYTKAAAAEMQSRLYRTLGEWALMDDALLMETLKSRLGPDLLYPPLADVRRLFARALDAPGGLRIQTIHSFCESLLRKFPLEAGILPGFSVLEDAEIEAIQDDLLLEMAMDAASHPDRTPLDDLLNIYGSLDEIKSFISKRQISINAGAAKDELLKHFDLNRDETVEDIKRCTLESIDQRFMRDLEKVYNEFSDKYAGSGRKYDQQVQFALSWLERDKDDVHELFERATNLWVTTEGEPYTEKYCAGNEHVRSSVPGYQESFCKLSQLFAEAARKIHAFSIIERTDQIHQVAHEFQKRYKQVKKIRQVLDFDDLISSTAELLKNCSEDWVRYKLDQGISHILLDEAQDTGADQWGVVKNIALSSPQKNTDRTLFVVGDKKQSIYSFQGADARLFDQERELLSSALEKMPYREESLFLSFRSALPVLRVVDELFRGQAGEGVVDQSGDEHAPAKSQLKGCVELWPLVRKDEKEDPDLWALPLDAVSVVHPYRKLSNIIADDIVSFVESGTLTNSKGHPRPVRYGDIMILCQRRTGIFPEIVRTLAIRGIPNGGTDRVQLVEDVVVQDLRSTLRFAVNHDDDLSLAEILKSPFGMFTEDELFVVAYGRQSSLWMALKSAACEGPLALKAAAIIVRIENAERIGRRLGAFSFLSAWLDEGQPAGRQLIRQRIGKASDDAIDELLGEALSFDTAYPRTLNGFLAHLENLGGDVKKELGDEDDVVRLMTVHGAKGLEAPVVYLPDASYVPTIKASSVIIPGKNRTEDISVFVPSKTNHPVIDEHKDVLKQRELQEYRRKLYVAATRAEQRLVICGTESGRTSKNFETPDDAAAEKAPAEASWYGLARQAFARLEEVSEKSCAWRNDLPMLLHGELPGVTPARDDKGMTYTEIDIPPWLFDPAEKETVPTVSFPSALDGSEEITPPISSVTDEGELARARGIAIHRLLEWLPGRAMSECPSLANSILDRDWPEIDPAIRAEWQREVLNILTNDAFGDVFGERSAAEVSLRGIVKGQLYSGQVDRLVITQDEIQIVDYKTMRQAPPNAAAVASALLRQMAIYRALLKQQFADRPVKAAILWTAEPRLMALDEDLLLRTLETIS